MESKIIYGDPNVPNKHSWTGDPNDPNAEVKKDAWEQLRIDLFDSDIVKEDDN